MSNIFQQNIFNSLTQPFIVGIDCSALYFTLFSLPADTLRCIAKDILKAFEFLEENNIVYNKLDYSSIYLDNNGNIKYSTPDLWIISYFNFFRHC